MSERHSPLARPARLVVATHNAGKLAEFHGLLAPHGIEAVSAGDLELGEPEETGATFEENAAIKALAAARASGETALADDSGLCVDALGGRPGVHTADYATRPDGARDHRWAMERLIGELNGAGTDPERRTARFVAVLCLATPDGATRHWRGEVPGTIAPAPRGEGGHGYDPLFVPEGHERTFGEMSAGEKAGLSHRARAFAAFAADRLS